jgi:Ca-activated chloride channel homolog
MRFLCVLIVTCNLSLFAQQQSPRLVATISEHEKPIQLSKIDVDVKILGEVAETRTTMTFYNPNERVLEGNLHFPLPEGVTISGYALDVNGVMVDGVAVEKHEARRVFEREERIGIDPGLVEFIKGNSFKTRIYPIPKKESRTVMVRYISELPVVSGTASYCVLLTYSEKIPQLHLRVEVSRTFIAPIVTKGGLDNFGFKAWHNGYLAESTVEEVVLNEDMVISFPNMEKNSVWVEKNSKGKYHFVISDYEAAAFVPKIGKLRHPARIRLYWDTSGSRESADHKREFALIEKLFERWKSALVSVDLILFSNRSESSRQFTIANGNAKKLLDVLQSTEYDGGTQMAAISPPADSIAPDFYLLFTDGLSNFGDEKASGFKAPLHIISASPITNYSFLSWLALRTQGQYFNLEQLDDQAIIAGIELPAYRFMSAEYNRAFIQESYPQIPESIQGRFVLAGKLAAPKAEILLKYGAQGRVLKTVKYIVRQQDATEGNMLETLWAQKKIKDLSMVPDSNQKDLVSVGKHYGLVTPRTSLLVLERLEQYVEYKITPPESLPKMREEYLEQMAETRREEKRNKEDGLERAVALWKKRVKWWETDYSIVKSEEKKKQIATTPNGAIAPESSGTVLNEQGIKELPLVNNDVMDLVNVMGGVVKAENQTFSNSEQTFAGVASENINIQRDGISINEARYSSGIVSSSRINPEMVGAFKTALSPVDAEMGRGFGQIQILTRSSRADVGEMIAIQGWDPATPYLEKLKKAVPVRYWEVYLQERNTYGNSPAFYLDCTDFFFKHKQPRLGLRILSNIAELQLENPAFLRILAHRLAQLGQLRLSAKLFETILKMRPEEPQSYRDLALVLAEQKKYVRAMELLNHVVMTEWDRFDEIEVIALMELNRIIPLARAQGISRIPVDPRLIRLLDMDVRIVLTWDADMTDIDLWVTEPSGEKAFYESPLTKMGGQVSKDFTEGYGPEEYIIHNAKPGKYLIQANYYGSDSPALQGPVTVQAEVFTNYGRKNERRKRLTIRLGEKDDVFTVGEIKFSKNL